MPQTREPHSAAERWINALTMAFVCALPGWFCVQVFDASPLLAIVPAAAVGFALGWFAGNLLMLLLDVLLGMFR